MASNDWTRARATLEVVVDRDSGWKWRNAASETLVTALMLLNEPHALLVHCERMILRGSAPKTAWFGKWHALVALGRHTECDSAAAEFCRAPFIPSSRLTWIRCIREEAVSSAALLGRDPTAVEKSLGLAALEGESP